MRRFWPPLALLAAPVLAHLPFWLAGSRENPIWFTSGLALLSDKEPFLPGLPGFSDPNAGWTTQALGTFAAREWLHGRIPWWDPFSGLGMPVAAEGQSSALFLPYILLLALPAGWILLNLSLQWTAGLATWRLLRALGLGSTAAFTGGALFELCGCFAWLGPPMSLPIAFLPLFLLGIERARAAAARGGGGWRLIAVAVALSLYAGFPETAYLDGLLALAFAVVRVATLTGRRAAAAARIVGGGAVGLMLAAPQLWPFLDLLPHAALGQRGLTDMASLSLYPQQLVQLLAPYALGPIAAFSAVDPSSVMLTLWGRAGSYASPVLLLAALLGATARGPDRALRWTLLGWAALVLARIIGAPGASAAFAAVPFHDQLQIFRYAGGSWLMPCCILAAYAVDLRARAPRLAVALSAALLAAGAATAALAWPLARTVPGLAPWFAASLAWGALTLGAAALLAGRRGRWWPALLVADAALLFMVPLAGGRREARLATGPIGFLQQHGGLQRFATLGPFIPNYGAMFGVASVNHSYLPSPASWAGYAIAELHPGGDPVQFRGDYSLVGDDLAANSAALASRLPAYAALGVRYVLTWPVPSPFGPAVTPEVQRRQIAPALTPSEGGTPAVLGPGGTLSGSLVAERRPITAIDVTIGTFRGTSSGTIAVRLCSPQDGCAEGRASIDGAPDNRPVRLPLERPVMGGPDLSWMLTQPDGRGVAVWQWPTPSGPTARLTPYYDPATGEPAAVYADRLATIYEVPGAAPYASIASGGPCALAARSRTRFEAVCEAPATLVRRELFWPGWRVRVGRAESAVGEAPPLFQTASLPAGPSRVQFVYRPPGWPWFTALFAAGLALLAPWGRVRRRAVRPGRPAGAAP